MYAVKKASKRGSSFFVRANRQTATLSLARRLEIIVLSIGLPTEVITWIMM